MRRNAELKQIAKHGLELITSCIWPCAQWEFTDFELKITSCSYSLIKEKCTWTLLNGVILGKIVTICRFMIFPNLLMPTPTHHGLPQHFILLKLQKTSRNGAIQNCGRPHTIQAFSLILFLSHLSLPQNTSHPWTITQTCVPVSLYTAVYGVD